MDSITGLRNVGVAARAAAPAPAPLATPAAPADAVTLSGATPSSRAWLWTGLATARLLGGAAVGGPLGAALSAQQKTAIREVLGELHGQGLKFFVDKGMLGGVFSSRYQDRTPDEVMGLIEAGPADFEAKLWVRRGDEEAQKLRSLGTLQQLDAFYGNGDPAALDNGRDAKALRNLEKAGWSFYRSANAYNTREEERTDALGAWRSLGADKDLILRKPDGSYVHSTGKGRLGSVDYFEGTGDASNLANPELGAKLKELEGKGFGVKADGYPYSEQGLRGAYTSLELGHPVTISLGTLTLGQANGQRPEDLDQAVAKAQESVDLYETVLKPDVEADRLYPSFVGLVLQALMQPVQGLDLQERTEMFQELSRAARSGPDKGRSLEQQTRNAYDTYEKIRKAGHTGLEFQNAVTLAAGLLTQVGYAHFQRALDHLTEEIPASTPFPEARRERETQFLRLLRVTGDVDGALAALEALEVRLGDEDAEARLQSLEKIARAGKNEKDYSAAAVDYRTMLASRLPGQSLEDATEAYTLLLGSLSRAGHAKEAGPTWRFLQDGLRFGHFTDKDSKAAVDRYLSTLLLTRDPEEARKKLLEPLSADKEPGKIEDGDSSVNVGGIVLPKK